MKEIPHQGIQNDSSSGSPQPGEPLYLSIGKLRRPHGIIGEMSMVIETDFPDRITEGLTVFVGEKKKVFEIVSVRPTNNSLLVRFNGIENPEDAGLLRNLYVYINAEQTPKLPTGRFYLHEVQGMKVVDETGQFLGLIDEIIVTGANDVYVIKNDAGEETLIPAIKSVVLKIDRENRLITVRLQEWA